jgi:tetratricopeptide (TPR) repeat protein
VIRRLTFPMRLPRQRPPGAIGARHATGALLVLAALTVLAGDAPAAAPAAARRTPVTRSPHVAPRHPAAATRARGTAVAKPVAELAKEARLLEDAGAYARAAATLAVLRGRVPADADLEIARAIDEARAGALDSARVHLASPLLAASLADTLPEARRTPYAWSRDAMWIDGRYTGWPWVIARARAEVAAALGRWTEARDAARVAVQMHPLAGVEHAILSVCAARAGDLELARDAAHAALALDPALPEAHDLAGLWEWRDGHRAAALEQFRAGVALDSADVPAALGLMRARLPGAAPDSFPTTLLRGIREAGLVTSPVGPKLEQFEQMDTPAIVLRRDLLPISDSLAHGLAPLHLILPILVDRNGRAAYHELPWFSARDLPGPVVARILESVPTWRFRPAVRGGELRAVWASVEVAHQQP